MDRSLADNSAVRHLDRLDAVRPRMAKAVKKIETPWKASLGRAVLRCFALAGLTQKEGAALIDRDPGQVGRWITGDERPQFDAIFAVARLQRPIVIALAELAEDGVEIVTEIRVSGAA